MTVAAIRKHTGWLIWVAYFVVPTDAGGLVGGIPLGPLEAAALLTLIWLAVRGEAPGGAWMLAGILVVSTAGAALVPGTGGFRARYFANAAATGSPERSTEFRDRAFTRIDRRLDFAAGGPEFLLAFFNDPSRFNFYQPGGPRRRQLEFAAAWSGQWWAAAGSYTLYLDAPQSNAQLFVDGGQVASVTPTSGPIEVTLPLAAGWHRLDASLSSPYGAARRFSAGEIRDGARRPFSSSTVVTQRVRPWQVAAVRLLRLAKTAVDSAVVAWLGWLFAVSLRRHLAGLAGGLSTLGQRSWLFPMLAIAVVTEALLFAWPWAQQLMVMAGGDDPMTYEWYSRDILLNGILMTVGAPIGAGEPFYYQAFYPYFLAAIHALFGEGMFGVLLIQRLLVAFTVWVIVKIAVEIAGEDAWPGALVCGIVFAVWKQSRISADLLNESLYVPLLVAWTAVVIRACRSSTTLRALGAGVLGAITAMTRSTVLLAWPMIFVACWHAWRAVPGWRLRLGVLVLSSIAVFSLVAARNWIVSGQFVMTSSELGVTLLGGNEPPRGLVIDLRARGAFYRRLGLSDYTAQVVEYAIVAPRTLAWHQGKKALFALGFYEPYAPGWGYSPIYMAGWLLAVAGLIVAMRSGRALPVAIVLPAVVSASQFIAVVAVYPKAERLILPIHALLVPYAGIAVATAASTLRKRFRPEPR